MLINLLTKFFIIIATFFMVVGCNPAYSVKFPIDNEAGAIAYAKSIAKNDKDITEFIQRWEKSGYKIKYSAYFNKKSSKWEVDFIPEQVLDAGYSIIFTPSGKIIDKAECQGG